MCVGVGVGVGVGMVVGELVGDLYIHICNVLNLGIFVLSCYIPYHAWAGRGHSRWDHTIHGGGGRSPWEPIPSMGGGRARNNDEKSSQGAILNHIRRLTGGVGVGPRNNI